MRRFRTAPVDCARRDSGAVAVPLVFCRLELLRAASRVHQRGAVDAIFFWEPTTGRDRLVRLLCATRISLLLAAAAAIGALLLAAIVGGAAGYLGGWFDRAMVRIIDLMLSLPWAVPADRGARAAAPQRIAAGVAAGHVFSAGAAGMGRPGTRNSRRSTQLPRVRLCIAGAGHGQSGTPHSAPHILPNLRPVLLAQFWTSIPIFILAEANLGFLG